MDGKILQEICKIFNYNFNNLELLNESLTRQAAISDHIEGCYSKSYQRLEFLGDSILNLIITDFLYEIYPDGEDVLTNLRSKIVMNKSLFTLNKDLNISKYLYVGRMEEKSNIRENSKALADQVESMIGAIFLDCGKDYNIIKVVVLNLFKEFILKDELFQTKLDKILDYYDRLDLLKQELNMENIEFNKLDKETKKKKYYKKDNNDTNTDKGIDEDLLKRLITTSNKEELSNQIIKLVQDPFVDLSLNSVSIELFQNIREGNMKSLSSFIHFGVEILESSLLNYNLKIHNFTSKLLLNFIIDITIPSNNTNTTNTSNIIETTAIKTEPITIHTTENVQKEQKDLLYEKISQISLHNAIAEYYNCNTYTANNYFYQIENSNKLYNSLDTKDLFLFYYFYLDLKFTSINNPTKLTINTNEDILDKFSGKITNENINKIEEISNKLRTENENFYNTFLVDFKIKRLKIKLQLLSNNEFVNIDQDYSLLKQNLTNKNKKNINYYSEVLDFILVKTDQAEKKNETIDENVSDFIKKIIKRFGEESYILLKIYAKLLKYEEEKTNKYISDKRNKKDNENINRNEEIDLLRKILIVLKANLFESSKVYTYYHNKYAEAYNEFY